MRATSKTQMPPPPATNVASRLFLGPALRAQPDRRLVSLVRDGYEAAFDEIVRRYGRPLGRYAAAIVPSHRAEDVTQDAFAKALLALRGSDKEIELRPWLYRIVRNTALNDLRDQPAAAVPLSESIDGVETPPQAAERREEIAELLRRLRALPDPQRAAIVMRELEGLSHEEIAAALGLTGGGARQAIYRARRALRDGVGMLVPLPVLQFLLDPAAGGTAGAVGSAAAAAGASGGAGLAMKAGLATVLVAGTVGTGVALHDSSRGQQATAAEPGAARGAAKQASTGASPRNTTSADRGSSGSGSGGAGDGRGSGGSGGGGAHKGSGGSGESHAGSGPGPSPGKVDSQSGGGGSGTSGGGDSGHHGSSGSGSGSGSSGSGTSGSGTGSSEGPGSGGSVDTSGSSDGRSGSGSSGTDGGGSSGGDGGSGGSGGSDDGMQLPSSLPGT